MKKVLKGSIALMLALCILLSVTCCAKKQTLSTGDLPIEHELEFGGFYIKITNDDFEKLGFTIGDSVDLVCSNGYKEEDLPFYDGYFTKKGEKQIIAYQGYPYLKAVTNNGGDLYEIAGLKQTDTARVTLREKGKYLTTQKALGMKYTSERSDYASDEEFANFREMKGGKLAPKTFYRSASIYDNQYQRAPYAAKLNEQAGVRTVMNLADNEEKLQKHLADPVNDTPYIKNLRESGGILAVGVNSDYMEDNFRQKTTAALKQMTQMEGPFLIHCTEGKDRTGYVCALIEMLAGASYEELEADYMKTYDNYYHVSKQSNPESYNAVLDLRFGEFLTNVCGKEDYKSLTAEELTQGAENYLRSGGMTDDEIAALKAKITR